MSPKIYNASLLLGIVAIGVGVALVNIPAALIVVGSLVIALTVFGAAISRKA